MDRRSCLVPIFLALGCVPVLETPEGAPGGPWEAPENGWPLQEPPEGLVGEGFHPGQTIPDFRLLDQHGDEVSLWQFYGQVVALDISAMWCRPCQALAEDTEATWQAWREDDFMYVTVLTEDQAGGPPGEAELLAWAETFDITAPIVADPDKGYSQAAITANIYPVVLVIDRDLQVLERLAQPTDDNLHAALEGVLGPPG